RGRRAVAESRHAPCNDAARARGDNRRAGVPVLPRRFHVRRLRGRARSQAPACAANTCPHGAHMGKICCAPCARPWAARASGVRSAGTASESNAHSGRGRRVVLCQTEIAENKHAAEFSTRWEARRATQRAGVGVTGRQNKALGVLLAAGCAVDSDKGSQQWKNSWLPAQEIVKQEIVKMPTIKSRVASRQKTATELDELIAVANALSAEITRKQEARPEHLTRLARVVARLAEHVRALQVQHVREETEGTATDG